MPNLVILPHLLLSYLSIRCMLGDIRLWVGDPSTSSCRVSLPLAVTWAARIISDARWIWTPLGWS